MDAFTQDRHRSIHCGPLPKRTAMGRGAPQGLRLGRRCGKEGGGASHNRPAVEAEDRDVFRASVASNQESGTHRPSSIPAMLRAEGLNTGHGIPALREDQRQCPHRPPVTLTGSGKSGLVLCFRFPAVNMAFARLPQKMPLQVIKRQKRSHLEFFDILL